MYTKEQMEAKEAECRTWREACELNRETLRDRFAMAALQGVVCCTDPTQEEADKLTAAAYMLADSMLKMRDIRRTSGTDSD